jgi:hypothetical protein
VTLWDDSNNSIGGRSLIPHKGNLKKEVRGSPGPLTGVSEWKSCPIVRTHVTVEFVWGMLLLLVLLDLSVGVRS